MSEKVIEVKDVVGELKSLTNTVNSLTQELGNRNLVGPKRDTVLKARVEALRNMLWLTSAAICNGLLDSDKYDLLRAEVSKSHFKQPADINSILKGLLKDMAKEPLDGSNYSVTELAKMIETPYKFKDIEGMSEVDGHTVVEVEDTNGNITVINKGSGETFTAENGEHPATTEGEVKRGFIRGCARWSLEAVKTSLRVSWSVVFKTCSLILKVLIFGTNFIYDGLASINTRVLKYLAPKA